MNSIKSKAKGITLVSLVVTIIVLLILAGIAINFTIGEDGIFKRAEEGAKVYQNASQNERIELDKVSNYIDNYLNGNKDEDKEELSEVEEAIKNGTVYQTNTIIYDEYNNQVKVPAGFKLAEDSGKDVTKGIVIEDVNAEDNNTKGNQYVWIPLGKVYKNEQREYEEIELGRYTFASNGTEKIEQSAEDYTKVISIEDYYQELITSNYGNQVAKNLEDFITKAKQSKGYYIGRYEVGDADATEARQFELDTSNTEAIPVIKKDKWPYTFVSTIDAATLAKSLYSENSSIESDLVNSYAWDTAIVFIQKFSGDIDYSQQNMLQNELTTTGNAHDEENNYDVRCNIYDMAGNARESTTETYTDTKYPCVSRGGHYNDFEPYTSFRGYCYANNGYTSLSFRTILYL